MEEIRHLLLAPEEADEWFRLLDDLEAMEADGMLEKDTNGGWKVTPKGHAFVAMADGRGA